MPLVIRKITYSKWWRNPKVQWLGHGELQADALRDIRTQEAKLSVFVTTDAISSDRVVAAIAANRNSLQNIDFALLDKRSLELKGFAVEPSPMDRTHDCGVNSVHHDIVDLTPHTLLELAEFIACEVSLRRAAYGKDKVAELMVCSIDAEYIDEEKLDPKLRAKLRDYRTRTNG